MRDEVDSACEMLGLDPIYVANEGIFVCIADPAVAQDVIKEIMSHEHGDEAVIIGEVSEKHPGQVVMNTTIGGRRVVNMLAGEQLPRIC